MNKDTNPRIDAQDEVASEETDHSPESSERRKAVARLAYASPVVAGILFSQRAAAQFSPPPPPPGG